MLKFFGSVLLIFACSALGFFIAHRYALRSKQLQQLQSAFLLLETEILYGLTPLPIAFDHLAKRLPQPINQLFAIAAHDLSQQKTTLQTAWVHALEILFTNSALTIGDIEILQYFGQGLGEGDLLEQQKKFRLLETQLAQQEKEAASARDKNQKVWQYLGITFGIAVVLILV